MADSDEPGERNETECNCLKRALAALLEDSAWRFSPGDFNTGHDITSCHLGA